MSYTKSLATCNPFLRWAGGKSWLLPTWYKLIDKLKFNQYHEPFVGGGTSFFALPSLHASYLSDINEELILAYKMVKDFPEELYVALTKLKNTKEDYYIIRDRRCRTDITKAARFIYLNQTSYNGLWRVNRRGEYNVPYGFRKNWAYEKDRLLKASQFLVKQHAHIVQQDFALAIERVQEGDFVFLDPPYTVSKDGDNGFIEYNETIFSLDDQKRLSDCIDSIRKRHAYYVLTNACHPVIAEMFDKGDRRLEILRNSCIGGKSAKRGPIKEFVFTNIPEAH